MALSKWKILSSERWEGTPFLHFRRDRVVSPRNGREYDVYVMEAPSWVNVIPVTSENNVVLVRQYRHGIREMTLEIPGGVVEAGDAPEEAARRELREETGYDAPSLISLGYVHPNPAIQNNRCYTFLARDVFPAGSPRPDEMEDIEVVVCPLKDVLRMIDRGDISHGLIVAAFCRLMVRYPELFHSIA